MSIMKINDDYFVSGQITADDLNDIKSNGINSIICNRPDGEVEDQPGYAVIEAKAKELGLEFRYIPVIKGPIEDEQVAQYKSAFAELPHPVLGYCRSGMRSTSLWALANTSQLELQEIIDTAAAAGYDISALSERIVETK